MVRSKKKKEKVIQKYETLIKEKISIGEALNVIILCLKKEKEIKRFLEEKLEKYNSNFDKLRETFRIVSEFPNTRKTELLMEAVAKKMLECRFKKNTQA